MKLLGNGDTVFQARFMNRCGSGFVPTSSSSTPKPMRLRLHPQYNKESQAYLEYINKYFRLVDEHGRKYQATSLTNPAYRPNLIYEYKGYPPPQNGWMITKEKMGTVG